VTAGDFNAFMRDIVDRKDVYSAGARLLGKKRRWVTVEKLRSAAGERFKMIELTQAGIDKGATSSIRKARTHLADFADCPAVPDLVYADERRIVTTWLEGVPLNQCRLGDDDFEALGRFAAESLRGIRRRPAQADVVRLRENVAEAHARGVLDPAFREEIDALLARPSAVPQELDDAVCFSDVALKNFLRDTDGGFRYVDVFGLARKPVGGAIAKHLLGAPPGAGHAFSNGFLQAPRVRSMPLNMTFSFLACCMDRIHAKSHKEGAIDRIRGNRKVARTVRVLRDFLEHSRSEDSVRAWLFGRP